MTATEAVPESWCAAPTTASSSVSTITRRTTAVRNPPQFNPSQQPRSYQGSGWSHPKARSAAGGTTRAGGAAVLTVPVMSARATVTARMTGVSMTATEGAGLAWCAGATTASSSEPTSTRRTTAASTRTAVEAGGSGGPGVPAVRAVGEASGAGTGSVRAPAVPTPQHPRPGYATTSPAQPRAINTNTRDLTNTRVLTNSSNKVNNRANIMGRDNINQDNINQDNISMDNISMDSINLVMTNLDNISMVNISMDSIKLDNISMDRITTGNTISKTISY